MIVLLIILPLSAALAADTSSGFSLDLLEGKGPQGVQEASGGG
jgi:hypothetical protein